MGEPNLNEQILVVGYGSLLSGYGLLAERRDGKCGLIARDAFPVVIENARRGLAKPSGHGRYLAMDIEPIETHAPITARIAAAYGSKEGMGGVLLEFDRKLAPEIARREEYDAARFLRLLEIADRERQPLGDYLLGIAESADFDADGYRRKLRRALGYTSAGYIFHPVPLDDGRVAIAAIASGYHSSGDPAVISRRRECGMDRLLSLAEALALTRLEIDRRGQIGYWAECLLGGLHGIAIGDLMKDFDPRVQWSQELAEDFRRVAGRERERFLSATSVSASQFLERFGERPAPSLAPLLKLAALG